ncbi:MAG: alanine racemase [Clostridium sp.]|nr:MAG: alanine racemase [Clostridium sp.]
MKNKVRNLILKAKDSKIIAASKYADISSMIRLYNLGIHDFGENRVDSFLGKYNVLNGYNITWHFIGHLQRNKAKYVLGKIDYLHSLDSVLLLEYIERYCKKPLNCFIEVNISNDENKFGIKPYELEEFLTEAKKYSMVRIVGLMTILKNGLSHQEKNGLF